MTTPSGPSSPTCPICGDLEEHIFLKPEVTKDFAERVGHGLAHSYSAELDFGVYEDLLDLAQAIRQSVIDLEPRDMIDIQSVIWVVGDYREGREVPQPRACPWGKRIPALRRDEYGHY